VAHKTGALAGKDLERVAVDTTVQPKNVAFPTDVRLMHKALSCSCGGLRRLPADGAQMGSALQGRRSPRPQRPFLAAASPAPTDAARRWRAGRSNRPGRHLLHNSPSFDRFVAKTPSAAANRNGCRCRSLCRRYGEILALEDGSASSNRANPCHIRNTAEKSTRTTPVWTISPLHDRSARIR